MYLSVLPETAKIRVRDFAKAKISLSFNEKSEETEVKNLVCSDIEIISVSSDEECNTTKKPKARRKRASKRLPAIPRGRRGPTPLKFKYHKIDEYFVKTKKEGTFHYHFCSIVILNETCLFFNFSSIQYQWY